MAGYRETQRCRMIASVDCVGVATPARVLCGHQSRDRRIGSRAYHRAAPPKGIKLSLAKQILLCLNCAQKSKGQHIHRSLEPSASNYYVGSILPGYLFACGNGSHKYPFSPYGLPLSLITGRDALEFQITLCIQPTDAQFDKTAFTNVRA